MQDIIWSILIQHKNKRITLGEMDKILRKHGINLFADETRQEQFIHAVQEYIRRGVLVPLRSARPLLEYRGLPGKYVIHRELITEKDAPLSKEYRNELFSLSSQIEIDYYANHASHYTRDRDYILRINDLINQNSTQELTANERSYEIFGDEKAITAPQDEAVDGEAVLRNLNLGLKDIRARRVFEPFFYIQNDFDALQGKRERTVLIIENKDTFWTLQEAVVRGDLRGVHLVIYGEGYAILKKFEYIRTIGGLPEDRYLYFGDIDREGISIFNKLQARYPKYEIRPSTYLYTSVLKKAGYQNACPLKTAQRAGNFSYSPFIDDFNEETRAEIRWIIEEERYLPQEVLNATDLWRLKDFGLSETF